MEPGGAVNIVALPKRSGPLPTDFPAVLRKLADAVESGLCTAFIGIAVVEGDYVTLEPSSLQDSLMLAALLQHGTAAKFLSP